MKQRSVSVSMRNVYDNNCFIFTYEIVLIIPYFVPHYTCALTAYKSDWKNIRCTCLLEI